MRPNLEHMFAHFTSVYHIDLCCSWSSLSHLMRLSGRNFKQKTKYRITFRFFSFSLFECCISLRLSNLSSNVTHYFESLKIIMTPILASKRETNWKSIWCRMSSEKLEIFSIPTVVLLQTNAPICYETSANSERMEKIFFFSFNFCEKNFFKKNRHRLLKCNRKWLDSWLFSTIHSRKSIRNISTRPQYFF